MSSFNGDNTTLKSYDDNTFVLNTADRTDLNDPDTNCVIEFNNSAIGPMSKIVIADITSVSICNNFYNIASYNNAFVLQTYDGMTLLEYPLRLTPNYYTATTLASALQTLLSAQVGLGALTVIYDATLRRIVIHTNSGLAVALQIDLNFPYRYYQNSFLWTIGATFSGQPLATSITMPNPTALFGATQIFLVSQKLAYTKNTKTNVTSEALPRIVQSKISNIVIAINITAPFGVYDSYYNNGSDRGVITFPSEQQFDAIDLKWVDPVGNVLQSDATNTPISIFCKIR